MVGTHCCVYETQGLRDVNRWLIVSDWLRFGSSRLLHSRDPQPIEIDREKRGVPLNPFRTAVPFWGQST